MKNETTMTLADFENAFAANAQFSSHGLESLYNYLYNQYDCDLGNNAFTIDTLDVDQICSKYTEYSDPETAIREYGVDSFDKLYQIQNIRIISTGEAEFIIYE